MIDLGKKQLFIFDFDGTIADTSHVHEAAFKKTLDGLNEQINFNYLEIKGMSTKDAFIQIMKNNKLEHKYQDLDELILNKQKCSRKMYKDSVNLLPGFADFFLFFKNKKRSIASLASRKSIEIILDHHSINNFDYIISSEQVINSKPHPECFIKILEHFQISAKDSVVFEDSKNGFLAAARANIEYIDITKDNWLQLLNRYKKDHGYSV